MFRTLTEFTGQNMSDNMHRENKARVEAASHGRAEVVQGTTPVNHP